MSETGHIRPVTLAAAGVMMARSLGLRWPDDRDEVVTAVNLYRELLYTEYPRFKLFDNATFCLCLQNYCRGCGCHTCSCEQNTGYRGIVLPRGQESLHGVWACNDPIPTLTRWRRTVVGLDRRNIDLPGVTPDGYSPVEQEMRQWSKLTLTPVGGGNEGAMVRVTGIEAESGDPATEIFSAEEGGESDKTFQRVTEVVIRGSLTAPVILSSADRDLGRYVPGDSVPQYRRYQVAVPCGVSQVFVQCVGAYAPIHFDDDIVELGSQLIMENIATWLRYRHAKNRTEQTTASLAYGRAIAALGGTVARHRGQNHNDPETAFKGRETIRGNRLY